MQEQTRPLYVIANEINANWPRPYYGARPYIVAMATMDTIDDTYGVESARSIIRYFLINAKPWHGEVARRIKAELKTIADIR